MFIILIYTVVCLTRASLVLLVQRIKETDPEEGNAEKDKQSWEQPFRIFVLSYKHHHNAKALGLSPEEGAAYF